MLTSLPFELDQVMAMCAIILGGPAPFLVLIVGVSLATAAMVGDAVGSTCPCSHQQQP